MNEQDITAFINAPTLRRKPAVIGQPQNGSNCQLSATTGFPAMSMPAGFTSDRTAGGHGSLLRAAVERADAPQTACACERAVAPRKPPTTTPPLAAR